MIETRHLYYFLAVAREQNITRAAESLHLTQPTLSKQLMDLEAQLGKKLLIRGKKQIKLTEEGAFLRGKAQEMIALMEKTESAFTLENQLVSGDIYIGCGETQAMDIITRVFKAIQDEYPDIHFHIHSGDADSVMERLDKGILDIGLLLGPRRQEKYDYINIRQKDVFGLLMPKDCELSKHEFITAKQLENLPIILAEQTFQGHQELTGFGEEYQSLKVVATYNLIYNATFMVERGIGYALCLDNLVNTAGRNLTFRPVQPEISIDLFLVTKKYQTFSPAMKIFIEKIREWIANPE